MGKTFSEKILAEKSGLSEVVAGQIINAATDVILSHDNSSAIAKSFKSMGANRVFSPDSVAIILDHCVPAASDKYASNHKAVREFVKEFGIKHFYDGGEGICHQVLPEKGLVKPGELVLGSDSHTTTHGAFGAFAAGIGRTETASIWATGKLWLRVPETMKIEVTGKYKPMVTAKDLALKILGTIGSDGALYKAMEFTGSAIRESSIADRMVLCNLSAEAGAKNGYVVADDTTLNWLKPRISGSFKCVESDPDAVYASEHIFDLNQLEPVVACPHHVDNVHPVRGLEHVKVHQLLLGTCTNGRLEDIEIAASILKGKRIHKDTRMLVFPASTDIYLQAMEKGYLSILTKAGAIVMNSGCGPCLGAHAGCLAPGEVCLSTANRNFKGRMGCKDSEIYLASPYTIAASALTGHITDPRDI